MANYIGEIILVGFNYAPSGWALCNGQLLSIASNVPLYSLIGITFGGNGTTTFGLPDLRGRAPIHQGQGSGLSNYSVGQKGGSESVALGITQIPNHTHTIDASGLTITARARNSAATLTSPLSAVPAIATVAPLTDSTLTAGASTIKAAHIIELRTRISALRAQYGLPTFSFTDSVLAASATLLKAQHITDLRSALADVYTAAGQPQPASYTDPVVSTSTTLKAAHITELRANVIALGGTGALPYTSAAPDANMNTASAIIITGPASGSVAGNSQLHTNMQPFLGMNFCICLTGVFPS